MTPRRTKLLVDPSSRTDTTITFNVPWHSELTFNVAREAVPAAVEERADQGTNPFFVYGLLENGELKEIKPVVIEPVYRVFTYQADGSLGPLR